ncbi:MAG: DUF4003 domain-containing protein [Lachnospiraceae bacterium]|nr:DUF4003 domain-containing protein [Lachnospiraceae bacterium]
MRDEVRRNCELLIQNRDTVQDAFKWGNSLLGLSAAQMITSKGKRTDVTTLKTCKALIKERTGAFSNFRGNANCAITAMLAVNGSAETLLEDGMQVHEMLKEKLRDSAYLPMAAMSIARLAERTRYEEIVDKTKEIYDRIKKEHPFLTSAEDSSFCALLAMSEKSVEALVTEAETCYRFLTEHTRYPKNSVQSLSHVLALYDGTAEEKCEKVVELYETFKACGLKYGTNYELPMLGILAMTKDDYEALAEELSEVSTWLSKQKGFGFWGSVTLKQRLMFAGMLLQESEGQDEVSETALLQSAIATVVAQEAAMLAVMAASASAAATAANS